MEVIFTDIILLPSLSIPMEVQIAPLSSEARQQWDPIPSGWSHISWSVDLAPITQLTITDSRQTSKINCVKLQQQSYINLRDYVYCVECYVVWCMLSILFCSSVCSVSALCWVVSVYFVYFIHSRWFCHLCVENCIFLWSVSNILVVLCILYIVSYLLEQFVDWVVYCL